MNIGDIVKVIHHNIEEKEGKVGRICSTDTNGDYDYYVVFNDDIELHYEDELELFNREEPEETFVEVELELPEDQLEFIGELVEQTGLSRDIIIRHILTDFIIEREANDFDTI